MLSKLFQLSLAVAMISVGSARADEPLRIFTGGPGAAKFLNAKKAELEKAVGGPVEVRSSPASASVKFLSKGVIQGLVTGSSPEETFKSADQKELAGDSIANYEWAEFAKVYIKIALNPDNTIKDLTHQQVTDLLSGKVSNWKEIGGPDTPVKVFLMKSSTGTLKEINEAYLKGEQPKNAAYVIDKDGLVRAIQQNKGAIAFTPTKDKLGEFAPRYITSEISHRTYYVLRKDASVAARKAFEFIKAMPKDGMN